ncbi:hypothetical protein LR48_Vigan04g119000 [Vigna angularis]|uniref:Uncharacterized protein n=1 Tax=Phaseolus angularis TaxID=3914 RepID=A0A0L9UEN3_PHAAN|nr:hypothetical protein LR48_Vigan04g119000 [Vigna angularis]
MIGEGSKCRDKGKGVARPKKRERQAPRYVIRVPTRLPTTIAPSPSSVGPSNAANPLLLAVADPLPPPATNPPPPPTVDILPPLVIITLTPPPDPTSIPFASFVPLSEIVTPSVNEDSATDGVDPPLHDRPWIQSYGRGFLPSIKDKKLERVVHIDEVFHRLMFGGELVDLLMKGLGRLILSQVRSEHGSTPTPDNANNEDDDIRRTQCWVDVVGGENKGRVYSVGQLATNYTTRRGGTLKHQPSSSTTIVNEVIVRLTFTTLVNRPFDLATTLPITRRPRAAHISLAHSRPIHISPIHTSPATYTTSG